LRALKGATPRAFTDHRTADGYQYRRYCRAIVERLGKLPDSAQETLRAAGVLAVDLQAIQRDLEHARARKRHRDVARLRRQLTPMRTQLLTLERRLEELAASRPRSFADAVRRASGAAS